MKSSLNWDRSFTHSKQFTGSFWDIAHPYKLLAPKYARYDDAVFLYIFYIFFIYLLFALAYLCTAWHIPPLLPFSTMNNISLLVNNFNSTSVFFKQACHVDPGVDKNEQGRVHIFQYICLNSFQIHQEAIMYHFEHTNHDNHHGFLVLIL